MPLAGMSRGALGYEWDGSYKAAIFGASDYFFLPPRRDLSTVSIKAENGEHEVECGEDMRTCLRDEQSWFESDRPPAFPKERDGSPQHPWTIGHQGLIIQWSSEKDTDPWLRELFNELAGDWRRETAIHSSITKKAMNRNYQRIIGLGHRVVPLILNELRRSPADWFWALSAITGQNPISPEDAGNLEKMTEAWLRLGRRRGWI